MNIEEYNQLIADFRGVVNVLVAFDAEAYADSAFDSDFLQRIHGEIMAEYERLSALLSDKGNYFESFQTGEEIKVYEGNE